MRSVAAFTVAIRPDTRLYTMQTSQTVPRRLRELRLFESPQRNAITWMGDDVFIFDYLDTAAATAADPDCADSTDDDCSSIVYENSEEDNSNCGTEAVDAEPFVPFVLPSHERDAKRTEVGITFLL